MKKATFMQPHFKSILALTAGVGLFGSCCLPAFGTPINLVQNGNFAQYGAAWSGNFTGWLTGWPTVPSGGSCALLTDIYQNVSTTPGQLYSLSFYAAADVFWGPTVDFAVELNNQPLASVSTAPNPDNPQLNRYEQMDWVQYTYSFIAAANTTRLEFVDQSTPYFGLTGVSLSSSVPDTAGTITLCIISGLSLAAFRRFTRERTGHEALKRIPSNTSLHEFRETAVRADGV